MNEMTDDEVFGKSTPVEMSDDEVFGKQAAAPPAPSVPLPRDRPEAAAPRVEMSDEEVFSPPAKVPLPRARPSEAPGLIQPTQAMPPVQEPTGAPFRAPGAKPIEGTDADLAGMLTGEQAYEERRSSIAGAQATKDEAEARLAEAKKRQETIPTVVSRRGTTGQQRNLAIDDEVARAEENLMNATRNLSAAERASPPTQEAGASAARGAMTNIMAGVPEMVAGAARIPDALGTDIAKYPAALVDKIRQLHPSDPARSGELVQQFGEGAGSMVPFIATGIVGKAAGLPQAAVSAVSGGLQNAEQYYREAETAGDKGYKKALSYVAGFAGGATEGIGSGRVLDQLDHLSGGGVKRYVGMILKSAGEEGLQEGMQQLYDNVAKFGLWGKDPGDITKDVATNALVGAGLGAMTAGLLSAPAAIRGRGGISEGGVPLPNTETVTPEQIQAQVAASGIPIHDPGGPTQPLPTNTPVTTEAGGVNTTTVLHGPAPAYTVTTDVDGKPTLKAAPDPLEWYNTINKEATGLYPSATGENVSIEAMAFQNGAHNSTWNVGMHPDTQLSPTIMDAYQHGQQFAEAFGPTAQVPPAAAAERESVPVEGFYSRLRAWVDEKGPGRLPVNEWLAKLKNNNAFTKEEMKDLHLEDVLNGLQGASNRPIHMTKEELLNHIDAMTAPMVEVTRTPLTPEEKQAKQAQIGAQITSIMAADPTARTPEGTPNYDHPLVGPLIDQHVNIAESGEWAKYEQYTTPGPRLAYTELTMHLPQRGATTKPSGLGPGQIGVVGEDVYGSHHATPNEVVTIRMTVRESVDGQKIALLEEGQSDVLQALKAGAEMPDSVYKESWPSLGFTRFVMWAAQQGITQIAWANSAEQMRRYPQGTQEAVARRKKGMEHFYDKVIPSAAKRLNSIMNLGATFGTTTIADTVYEVRQLPPVQGAGGLMISPGWGVFAPGMSRAAMFAPTQAMAMEIAEKNTTHTTLQSMVLPPSAVGLIQQSGVPSYSGRDETPNSEGANVSDASPAKPAYVTAMQPLVQALNSLIKKLKLGVAVTVVLHDKTIRYKVPDPNQPGKMKWDVTPNSLGRARYLNWKGAPGKSELTRAEIHIAVGNHGSATQVWATMVHELGHIVMHSIYHKASASVRTAVQAAYDVYKAKVKAPGTTMDQLISQQSNAASLAMGDILAGEVNTLPIDSLTQKKQDYWTGFDEWFAEQVAKWATSSIKPLSHVEKFFAGLGHKIMDLLEAASKMFGMQFAAVPELAAFLDGFLGAEMNIGPKVDTVTQQETTVKNATQMSPEDVPAPAQPEILGAETGINGAFEGRPPAEAQEGKAYADKFSWLRKMFYAIHHLATANPHIQALQDYVETVSIAKLTKDAIMIRAQEVLRSWNALGGKQADAVSQLLDDIQNMTYRTAAEVAAKVARHPTMPELQAMAQHYGVTQAGLAVVGEIGKSFQEFLQRVEAVLRSEANKIADPTRKALQHAKIDKQMMAYRSKPYFPAIRFGSYTITIRNAAKQVIHFETFETKRQRDQAFAAINHQLQGSTDVAQAGFLDKESRPLLGLPGPILELIGEKLNLSAAQKDALDQLKFELSPAQSFKHRFQHKKRIQGYSTDFQRAYANYFWHGANHLMKTMYADRLRALTKMAVAQVKGTSPDITKREQIAAFMSNHTNNWLDPKPDWAWLNAIAFVWHLAFVPAAAAQNMTQTMMTSFPHLSSKFGPHNAFAAIIRAGANFQTFYSKGTLARQTAFEQKALFQGMEDGVIKETQAPELAGYADGNVLSKGWGGNQIMRYMTKFQEMGAFMFEMAEQVNRRLVFRATLQLALDNPNAKYVKDAVAKRNLLYQKVRGNMTEAEASAYVAAYDATVTTQFQYGKEFSPRAFQGRKRAFFVFKTFMLNYVIFLLQNPHAAVYSLIIMAALGGLMGVPGSEDLKELLRVLAWQVLGKDFKLDREIRKWVIELLGKDGNGANVADLILHGASRKGFGIPAALNLAAGTAGIDFTMPTFDRSKAISGGTLLPVELGKLFGPPLQSSEKSLAEQSAKASGAIFGVGFSIYNAMRDQQLNWSDSKRWERVVPRELGNISKAYRAYSEEGLRSRSGAKGMKVDPRDNLGMAEIVGIGMGYTPYRVSLEGEKLMSKLDAVKLYDIRREDLSRQFGNATLGKDQAEKGRVLEAIRQFNKDLPPEAKGKAITNETLQKSVETRAQKRVMEEKGLSTKKSDIPIMRAEDKLYPESQRTTRPVPRNMTP